MKRGFIAILLVLLAVTSSAWAQRAPYIQNVTSNSVTIMWTMPSEGTPSVKYGTTISYGREAAGPAAAAAAGTTGLMYKVEISGLQPSTKYFYQAVAGATAVSPAGDPEFYFQTAPSLGSPAPYKFGVLGDPGRGNDYQIACARLLDAQRPDFVIVTGDLVYDYGKPKQEGMFFSVFKDIMRHTPFFVVCGNHDSSACNEVMADFALPQKGEAVAGVLSTFSFDWGNMHLAGINSNKAYTNTSPQMVWLNQDMTSSAQPWKTVFWHHNGWSAGSHPTDAGIVNGPVQLAKELNANFVFWGHSHAYERHPPLGNTAYFTIGNSGSSGVSNCSNCLYKSGAADQAGYLLVQVNNRSATLEYYSYTGAKTDTASYTTFGGAETTPPVSQTSK